MAQISLRKSYDNCIQRVLTQVKSDLTKPTTLQEVHDLLKEVENNWQKIQDAHFKILDLCADDDARNVQDDVYVLMYENYLNARVGLQKLKASLTVSPSPAQQSNDVKLPGMRLPKFSGKREEWRAFNDLFKGMIDSNSTLTGARKLQYLKTCLEGEAASLINSFDFTDANYKEAWDILVERYDNKREIIFSLIKKLLFQPKINTESAKSIQDLLSTTSDCLRCLSVWGQPTDTWDSILIVMLTEKLDPITKAEWAKGLTGTDLIEFKDFTEFLKKQVRALESRDVITSTKSTTFTAKPKPTGNQHKSIHHSSSSSSSSQQEATCPLCSGAHPLWSCHKLRSMDPADRITAVKETSFCTNCLHGPHPTSQCTRGVCKHCGGHHHSLLHVFKGQSNQSNQSNQSTTKKVKSNHASASTQQHGTSSGNATSTPSTVVISNHAFSEGNSFTSDILLKTAIAIAHGISTKNLQSRLLIDDGSEASFMKESTARTLGLIRRKTDIIVTSVGSKRTAHVQWIVTVRLESLYSNSFIDVDALLLPAVTGTLPSRPVSSDLHFQFLNLQLADPEYFLPRDVDILLGADVLPSILKPGLVIGPNSKHAAQNTIFGWTLFGKAINANNSISSHSLSIEEIMSKFWEVEKVPTAKPLTEEERDAEQHFMSTVQRQPDGRYIVRLPTNAKLSSIGESKELASRRLVQLEHRFKKNSTYHEAYKQFMSEYLQLGHMKPVSTSSSTHSKPFYIPHHYVVKEESTTTKLRVVFDASMKSSTGVSLNGALLAGPTIQPDLYTLLIKFRLFKVALKADVAKMYRQFFVHHDDCHLQRILWRDHPSQQIREYELCTVTYGTACAPFLATRCLVQLANDEESSYPNAARLLRDHMYVDDLMGGASSEEEAIHLQKEIVKLCSKGQLSIRKWCSSSSKVLSSIPPELRETGALDFETHETVKALGVRWQPAGDYFFFNLSNQRNSTTKREIFSDIASCFDPIGLITPVTIQAKIIMQNIWRSNVSWDSQVASRDLQKWKQYQDELRQIVVIQIPRRIITASTPRCFQIHAFCDASENAYATVFYLRALDTDGKLSCNLITSKSRVAPLQQQSLPRLELCGAHLLTETYKSIKGNFPPHSIHAWTDSMIVLQWLTRPSRNWKTYVANRVAAVQEAIPPQQWNHVISGDNPADLPTRGVSPVDLQHSSLWWHGPAWLQTEHFPVTSSEFDPATVEAEQRNEVASNVAEVYSDPILDKLFTISSYNKIVLTMAIVLRFALFQKEKDSTLLKVADEQRALQLIIKLIQRFEFRDDVRALTARNKLSNKSKLLRLNPFLDSDGVMRVGGRIQNSCVKSIECHPIVLPSNNHFTTSLIIHHHLSHCHGGFQLTLSSLRRRYWIVGGRVAVRTVVQRCIPCRKTKSILLEQQMGSLPSPRVTPHRAFLHSGVDFAGPFTVRMRSGRGIKSFKCYMAVYVCFSTKACHLEAVTSLSTEAFIASFRRFVARRGVPSHIYSDCGTNFVGAAKEFKKLIRDHNSEVQQQFRRVGTTWTFNPPSAPHRGGLWEAAVKSAKTHMERVVGKESLTHEQFTTLLCNIEACLNSRPLCALSVDPLDFDALTPGHFLIGEPLTALPEPQLEAKNQRLLDQFQRVQAMTQAFWRRWKDEYLTTLQQRPKWQQPQRNLHVGDLVAIKDECVGPTQWRLGRVVSTVSNSDGLVRRAIIKTSGGEFSRPVQKLSPVLFHDEV